MADKQDYTVNRAMQDGAVSYARGDTRQLNEVDAATLLASGAISEKGARPAEREPAVRHTFGAEKSTVGDYTSAAAGSVVIADKRANSATAKAKK